MEAPGPETPAKAPGEPALRYGEAAGSPGPGGSRLGLGPVPLSQGRTWWLTPQASTANSGSAARGTFTRCGTKRFCFFLVLVRGAAGPAVAAAAMAARFRPPHFRPPR